VDGIEALGEEALEFLRLGDFGFVRRSGKDVHGFDDFFVELEPFAIARGGLFEGLVDDSRDGVEAHFAAGEVIAVNSAKNFFGGDKGEWVRLLMGTHGGKVAQLIAS